MICNRPIWRRILKKGANIPQRSSSRCGCILRFPLSEVTQKRRTNSKGYTTPVFCASVQFLSDSSNHWCTHLSYNLPILYRQILQKSIPKVFSLGGIRPALRGRPPRVARRTRRLAKCPRVRIPAKTSQKQNSHPRWDDCFTFGGVGGIRTHVPVRANGFRDRPVMTASIPLRILAVKMLQAAASCGGLRKSGGAIRI